MSAIFGLVGLRGRPVARHELDRMNASLQQHGSDGGAIWSNGSVGLGQRLRCVTPEDRYEQQPLMAADDACVLVSDGRLDNRRELVDVLGVSARLPDSAFLLRAYEKWGADCAAHLVGAFALALWDNRSRMLLLARSSQGERPLYFRDALDAFAFASTPFALFALPGAARALDEQYLADYLARERAEPGATFFRGIRRLMPGHTLVLDANGLRSAPHWRPPGGELRLANDAEYVEAFDALFTRVVTDHLRSERPVGIMLSGGLDSSSVAVTAAPLLAGANRRLRSFTEVPRNGFDGPVARGRYADERPFVRAIAGRYANIDAAFVDTAGRFFLDDVERQFDAAAVPFRTPSNRVWYEAILAEAERQGIGVLLCGLQGNLTISWGGDGLIPQLLRNGRYREAFHEAAARRGSPLAAARAVVTQGVLPLLPAPVALTLIALRRPRSPGVWSRHPWRRLGAINPAFAREQRVHERACDKGADFRLRLTADTRWQRVGAAARVAELFDGVLAGYHAMYGVDTRDPTGDQRIVDFCLSLPERQYARDGTRRWLVRRAMRERLPPEVLDNPGRGFQVADWFDRTKAACGRIEEELETLERSDLARRAIDLPRLRHLVRVMPAQDPISTATLADYRHTLEFGLMTGRFIRWFEALGTGAPAT